MPGDALLSVAAVLFDMDGTLVESDASDLPLRDLFHLAALLPATRPAGASPRTK
jgi:phosphoglycolate phosphatase-like HAD superfamily hydrolase